MSALPGYGTANRRSFLIEAGGGLGAIALSSLLGERVGASELSLPKNTTEHELTSESPLAPRRPHFVPRARRVIWLFMHGGPSHVDLFDPKPDLVKYAGQPLPPSFGPAVTRR